MKYTALTLKWAGWEIKQKKNQRSFNVQVFSRKTNKKDFQIILHFSNSRSMIVKYQNNCLGAIKNNCTYPVDNKEIIPLLPFSQSIFWLECLQNWSPISPFQARRNQTYKETLIITYHRITGCLDWKRPLRSLNPAIFSTAKLITKPSP